MDFDSLWEAHPLLVLLFFAALSVLLHAWGFFKSDYAAKHWALKPERHKALHTAAWLAAIPLRAVFALFSGVVATLVWALLAFFVYATLRIVQG